MPSIYDIMRCLSAKLHLDMQPDYDHSGLLVGNGETAVSTVMFCLDATPSVMRQAAEKSAQLIVSHHPVIWNGPSEAAALASELGIGVISVHIPADSAEGGANLMLAEKIGLDAPKPFLAVNTGGVLICEGYSGSLGQPAESGEFARRVSAALGCPVRYCEGRTICTAAVCGGSGGFLVGETVKAGIDCLVTGEVKHSQLLEAEAAGITVIDATHYATEIHIAALLKEIVSKAYPGLTTLLASEPSHYKFTEGN